MALFGGVAARAYGALDAASPGFGLTAAGSQHLAASASGFACAGLAATSALVSALWIRRPS